MSKKSVKLLDDYLSRTGMQIAPKDREDTLAMLDVITELVDDADYDVGTVIDIASAPR